MKETLSEQTLSDKLCSWTCSVWARHKPICKSCNIREAQSNLSIKNEVCLFIIKHISKDPLVGLFVLERELNKKIVYC